MPLTPSMLTLGADSFVTPTNNDRDALANLMLAAYRNTIDDEGETMKEALEAVEYMLVQSIRAHSFVAKVDDVAVAMSLVVKLRGTYYIDPVAVAASHKRNGLGTRIVKTSLASLAECGVTEVGATITDGNVPSECLFAYLGASRIGPWPPLKV